MMCGLICLAGLSGCTGSSSAISGDGGSGTVDRSPISAEGGSGSAGPAIKLVAAESAVESGDSVELSWSSDGASDCQASGGWSGSQPVQGRAVVGPLTASTTFTLSCSGSGGNAMAMLSVGIIGIVSLNWQPPSENVDGSPLTDLAGYRIHYGSRSRAYDQRLDVPDPATTQRELKLASGAYYFAMTALDREGNESAYSNEVLKTLN